jgi:hypothetical protein
MNKVSCAGFLLPMPIATSLSRIGESRPAGQLTARSYHACQETSGILQRAVIRGVAMEIFILGGHHLLPVTTRGSFYATIGPKNRTSDMRYLIGMPFAQDFFDDYSVCGSRRTP